MFQWTQKYKLTKLCFSYFHFIAGMEALKFGASSSNDAKMIHITSRERKCFSLDLNLIQAGRSFHEITSPDFTAKQKMGNAVQMEFATPWIKPFQVKKNSYIPMEQFCAFLDSGDWLKRTMSVPQIRSLLKNPNTMSLPQIDYYQTKILSQGLEKNSFDSFLACRKVEPTRVHKKRRSFRSTYSEN